MRQILETGIDNVSFNCHGCRAHLSRQVEGSNIKLHLAIDDILLHRTGQRVGVVTHRIPIALIKVRFQAMNPDIVRTLQLPNCYWETIEI